MKKETKYKLLSVILILLVVTAMNYFLLVPLNLRYTGIFMLFVLLIVLIVILFTPKLFDKKYVTIGTQIVETKVPNTKIAYLLIGAFVLVVIHGLSASPIFFSKEYQSLIGDVEERNFIEDFAEADTDNLPVVNLEYAKKLGDKKIGTDRGLGSEFHVGEYSDIVVNGRMMLVAPLEFNDFFKWMNNGTTPGYVTVDKVTGEVTLVTSLNEKKLNLKYLETAFFNHNLKRHAYFNGNMTNELSAPSFELDEKGRPYYVMSKFHKTISISGGKDVLSVITVDVQTGDVKEYPVAKVPSWIDNVYPKDLILKQLDDWGLYVNGYFNTLFSEKEIIRITPDEKQIYNNGKLYLFTGMSSAGADESTVGFSFVDRRTKKAIFYKLTGATENAARASAEGKVENYGYHADLPLPVNIENTPTFFSPLKDSKGLIKQYAFINIENYSIVGTGETIQSAKESYLKALNKEYVPNEKDEKEVVGKIRRIGSDTADGVQNYYFLLESDDTLYFMASTVSSEINVTNIGDEIKIKFSKGKVLSFDNLSI